MLSMMLQKITQTAKCSIAPQQQRIFVEPAWTRDIGLGRSLNAHGRNRDERHGTGVQRAPRAVRSVNVHWTSFWMSLWTGKDELQEGQHRINRVPLKSNAVSRLNSFRGFDREDFYVSVRWF